MKLLRSQSGLTVTELMVSIVISGLLMAVAATGFVTFFTKFADLSKTIELQRDAFNCLQTIKSGIPIGNGPNLKFSGVATADSLVFANSLSQSQSHDIILYPGSSNFEHVNDYVRIYLYNGYVMARYLDGSFQPPPIYIFPKYSRRNTTTVTDLTFTKANTNESVPKVISVKLDARAKIRGNQYKSVSYVTKMAIALK
jgi:prepilin-type N-terminal cleavage/methylation domain-containing protein